MADGGRGELLWAVAAAVEGEVAASEAAYSEAAPVCSRAASVGFKLW